MDKVTKVTLMGIKTRLKMSEVNLEQLARGVDETFEGIDVRNLPEHEAAIAAIRAYEVALVKHILDYTEPSKGYTKDD